HSAAEPEALELAGLDELVGGGASDAQEGGGLLDGQGERALDGHAPPRPPDSAALLSGAGPRRTRAPATNPGRSLPPGRWREGRACRCSASWRCRDAPTGS